MAVIALFEQIHAAAGALKRLKESDAFAEGDLMVLSATPFP